MSPMDTVTPSRPRGDDRRRSHRLRLSERRSGFDRRQSLCRSRTQAALDALLLLLREHPRTLVGILALANLLSLLDLALTQTLLRAGAATEANPVMAYLLTGGAAQAVVVKTGIVLVASLAIWALRRRRAALTAAVFFVTLYGAVVLYELAGLTRLA
jgi:hypothetical protein